MSRDDDWDRLPPPPIDPLPDVTWARVERAVLVELDSPETRKVSMPRARWPLAFALGGALAAAATIAIVIGGRGAPSGSRESASLPSRVVTGDAPSEV